MIPLTQLLQTADTLKYLYMGGRVGMAHSRIQAYRQMADYVKDAVGQGRVKITYVHAVALEETQKLKTIV